MIIRFPDGSLWSFGGDTQVLAGWTTATPSYQIRLYDPENTVSGPYIYNCFNNLECVLFIGQIAEAFRGGQAFLDLLSLAPNPTTGNVANRDMFVNGLATAAAVGIKGGDLVSVMLGPPPGGVVFPYTSISAITLYGSFQPNFSILVGSAKATNLVYVNSQVIMFRTPQNPAGNLAFTYTDGRGSVTKADATKCFTYS